MKNRILRSALSVALCAAMLLSQGLTAFADGEIDLAAAKSSPVQEKSEELVPGASDLKPEIKNVVLPQRAARAATLEIETYNVPNPTNYTEIFDYSALDNNCEIHIYTNASSADSVKPIDWNNKTVLFPNVPEHFLSQVVLLSSRQILKINGYFPTGIPTFNLAILMKKITPISSGLPSNPMVVKSR